MWNDLEKGFQFAFREAWEAYKNSTIPIGVAIMNEADSLMATGQNQIYTEGDGLISLHQIAHAEINAILKLSEITDHNIYSKIRTFTLYSTMEPCPLCFGAIVMGSIKNVKYAARDNYAGAAALNDSIAYIRNKKITVTGPFEELEVVQIALQTCHEMGRTDNARYIDDSYVISLSDETKASCQTSDIFYKVYNTLCFCKAAAFVKFCACFILQQTIRRKLL